MSVEEQEKKNFNNKLAALFDESKKKLDDPPVFIKSYSGLSNLASYIKVYTDRVINLQENSVGAKLLGNVGTVKKNLFEIPQNHIKSFSFEFQPGATEGGTGSLVLEDPTGEVISNVLIDLAYKQSLPGLGYSGTTFVVEFGWVKTESSGSAAYASKNIKGKTISPKLSKSFRMLIGSIDTSTSGSKITYTIKLNSPVEISDPFLDMKFKPFFYLSTYPLFHLTYSYFLSLFLSLSSLLGQGEKSFEDYNSIKKIKNISDRAKKLENNLYAKFCLEFGVSLEDKSSMDYFKTFCQLMIPETEYKQPIENTRGTSSEYTFDKVLKGEYNLTDIQNDNIKDILQKLDVQKFQTLNKYLSPLAKDIKIYPYAALLFLLKQMKLQNEDYEKQGENKIIFVSAFDEKKISNIEKVKVGNKIDYRKCFNNKDISESIGVNYCMCRDAGTSWLDILNEVASKVNVTPGEVKSDKNTDKNNKNLKVNLISIKTKEDDGGETNDYKVMKNVVDLFAEEAKKKNENSLWVTAKNEIDDAKKYKFITLVTITEDTWNFFNRSSQRILQSYTVNPSTNPGSDYFSSGSQSLGQNNFPDVISFEPKINNFQNILSTKRITNLGDLSTSIESLRNEIDSTQKEKDLRKQIDNTQDEKTKKDLEAELNSLKDKGSISLKIESIEKDLKRENEKLDELKKDTKKNEKLIKDFEKTIEELNKKLEELKKLKEEKSKIIQSRGIQTLISSTSSFSSRQSSQLNQIQQEQGVQDIAKSMLKDMSMIDAELKIFGEPAFAYKEFYANGQSSIFLKVNNQVTVNGRETNFFLSGIWDIRKISMNIDSGKFTTNLSIKKDTQSDITDKEFFNMGMFSSIF